MFRSRCNDVGKGGRLVRLERSAPILLAAAWLVLACLVCAAPPAVHACLHPPEKVEVNPVRHNALILHREGTQTIVTQFQFSSVGASEKLGIVFPVPATPTDYGVVPADFFSSLFEWIEPYYLRRYKGPKAPKREQADVVELPAVSVGPYDIQPLKSSEPSAVAAWLQERGLQAIPPRRLQYYADNGWTFLVVEVAPVETERFEPGATELPPLRITFPSPGEIRYPLELERPAVGAIPAQMVFITDVRLPRRIEPPLPDLGFRGHRKFESPRSMFVTRKAPGALAEMLEALGGAPGDSWNLRMYEFTLVNYETARIAQYGEEPSEFRIDLTGDADVPAETEPQPVPQPKPKEKTGGCNTAPAPGGVVGFVGFLLMLALVRARRRTHRRVLLAASLLLSLGGCQPDASNESVPDHKDELVASGAVAIGEGVEAPDVGLSTDWMRSTDREQHFDGDAWALHPDGDRVYVAGRDGHLYERELVKDGARLLKIEDVDSLKADFLWYASVHVSPNGRFAAIVRRNRSRSGPMRHLLVVDLVSWSLVVDGAQPLGSEAVYPEHGAAILDVDGEPIFAFPRFEPPRQLLGLTGYSGMTAGLFFFSPTKTEPIAVEQLFEPPETAWRRAYDRQARFAAGVLVGSDGAVDLLLLPEVERKVSTGLAAVKPDGEVAFRIPGYPRETAWFTADGERAVVTAAGVAEVWEVSSGRQLRRLAPRPSIDGAFARQTRLSRDEKRLVLHYGDTVFETFDTESLESLGAVRAVEVDGSRGETAHR